MHQKLNFKGLTVTAIQVAELKDALLHLIYHKNPAQVVTFNSLMYLESLKNKEYFDAIKNAELVVVGRSMGAEIFV